MSTIINDKRVAQEKPKQKTYHVGQWFIDSQKDLWVLAYTDLETVNLNNIHKGKSHRYGEPTKVKDVWKITQKEFDQITGGDRTFTQVQVEINIIKNL